MSRLRVIRSWEKEARATDDAPREHAWEQIPGACRRWRDAVQGKHRLVCGEEETSCFNLRSKAAVYAKRSGEKQTESRWVEVQMHRRVSRQKWRCLGSSPANSSQQRIWRMEGEAVPRTGKGHDRLAGFVLGVAVKRRLSEECTGRERW